MTDRLVPNKLGVHAFVWAADWTRDDATRAIALTRETGYDLLEVSALDLGIIDVAHTRRELEQHGLSATISFGLDASCDISSTDPERIRAGERFLMDAVSVGRDMGATHLCGILYSAFQKYAVPPTADGVKNSVEVMRRVGEKAAESNIILGMEVVNRYETNMLNTAAQGVEYCRRVGLPNVRVHLDVYHMNIEESDPARAIRETGEYLGYFHTGENHRGYMGSGQLDYQRIFRALIENGYAGPITFESFSSRVVGQPLEGILGIWRNLWEDSRDLASHAYAFTTAQLASAAQSVRNAERSVLV